MNDAPLTPAHGFPARATALTPAEGARRSPAPAVLMPDPEPSVVIEGLDGDGALAARAIFTAETGFAAAARLRRMLSPP